MFLDKSTALMSCAPERYTCVFAFLLLTQWNVQAPLVPLCVARPCGLPSCKAYTVGNELHGQCQATQGYNVFKLQIDLADQLIEGTTRQWWFISRLRISSLVIFLFFLV